MSRPGAGCKGCWGEPVQACVRAFCVVVDPPCFDDLPGRRQAAEQVLVQALVPEPSVEALHEPVVLRLPSVTIPAAMPQEPWATPPGAME